MKKRNANSKKVKTVPVVETTSDGLTHFRLCHVCLHLNESPAEISQCSKCKHVFSGEGWIEEETDSEMDILSQISGFTDSEEEAEMNAMEEEEELMRLPMPNRKIYQRVHGLAVVW